jgi:hypothetical protein
MQFDVNAHAGVLFIVFKIQKFLGLGKNLDIHACKVDESFHGAANRYVVIDFVDYRFHSS